MDSCNRHCRRESHTAHQQPASDNHFQTQANDCVPVRSPPKTSDHRDHSWGRGSCHAARGHGDPICGTAWCLEMDCIPATEAISSFKVIFRCKRTFTFLFVDLQRLQAPSLRPEGSRPCHEARDARLRSLEHLAAWTRVAQPSTALISGALCCVSSDCNENSRLPTSASSSTTSLMAGSSSRRALAMTRAGRAGYSTPRSEVSAGPARTPSVIASAVVVRSANASAPITSRAAG